MVSMTTEEKRLFSIVSWCTLFIIPLWSIVLWALDGNRYLIPYLIVSGSGSIASIVLLLFRRNFLFWYFICGTLALFTTMTLGISLITGVLLIFAFGKYVPPNIIMLSTLLVYVTYFIFPIKYYYNDYHKTEKDRLKSFDFKNNTYDIKQQSIVRGDAFADFYVKSFLSKAHYGIIRLHIIFPIGGGAIAIIAGNISKNLQLTIGVSAVVLTTILFIQIFSLGFFNAWQVYRLEKKYGKKIMIDWGEEE